MAGVKDATEYERHLYRHIVRDTRCAYCLIQQRQWMLAQPRTWSGRVRRWRARSDWNAQAKAEGGRRIE